VGLGEVHVGLSFASAGIRFKDNEIVTQIPTPVPMPASPSASTGTAGAGEDPGRPRIFPCEGCGADLTFSVDVQSLKCPYCGFVKALAVDDQSEVAEQDFAAALERIAERRRGQRAEAEPFKEVKCDSCGSTVRFTGTLTSSECAYCGVPLQLDRIHDAPDRVPVDGVLPFKVKRGQARENLDAWVRSRWFAPGDFKKRGVQGRFNGLYLPYWSYDSMTATRYAGQRGEHHYVTVGTGKNRRRQRRTRWYPASGSFQRFFDDVLVVAGTGLPKDRIVKLEPWPLDACMPFNAGLLAGFLARTYDVELDAGFTEAKTLIDEAIEREVLSRIGGDDQRIFSIDTRYHAVTYKHLLLPVWMLAYRYRERSYQVVVNAGTGEVQGDRPYSWIKILLAVVAGLTVTATIAYFAAQL
jgi:hypothetical protein